MASVEMIGVSQANVWLSRSTPHARYDEDAALAASVGCNGFRLGLEWSRLQPRRGEAWDTDAVQRWVVNVMSADGERFGSRWIVRVHAFCHWQPAAMYAFPDIFSHTRHLLPDHCTNHHHHNNTIIRPQVS